MVTMATMAEPQRIKGALSNPVVRAGLLFLARKKPGQSSLLERILLTYEKRSVWYLTPFYSIVDRFCDAMHISRDDLISNIIGNMPLRTGLVNMCRSIGRYGPTFPQPFVAPMLVVWNFTNRCNLRCRHCYQEAGRPLPDELTVEEQRHVIDELAQNNVPMLAFAGGEPLISPSFWEIARYARDRGIWTSVASNGTLITKDNARRLKEVGINYVEVSIDSAQPEKHDAFRGVAGYWNRAVDGVRNAVAVGIRVGLAPTMTTKNIDELQSMVDLARELGAQNFCAFNLVPTGRGKDMVEEDLTPWQREEMLATLYENMGDDGLIVMTTCPQLGRFCVEQDPTGPMATSHMSVGHGPQARFLAEYTGGCGCGRAYCAIQPNGIVTPCVFMPIQVGDLREQSLSDIWENSPTLRELRSRENLKEHCGICEYRNVCGGCRARAYGYYGDYLAADPGCKFNSKAWQELSTASQAVRQPCRTTQYASAVAALAATADSR